MHSQRSNYQQEQFMIPNFAAEVAEVARRTREFSKGLS